MKKQTIIHSTTRLFATIGFLFGLVGSSISQNNTVLLEQFTAFKTVNGIPANEFADQAQSQFADSLVVVNIHYSPLSEPNNFGEIFTLDLRCNDSEGDSLAAMFNIFLVPVGMVDRQEGGSMVVHTNWEEYIDIALEASRPIHLEVDAFLNATSDSLILSSEIIALEQLSGQYNLVHYFVEDGLEGYQESSFDGPIPYTHNNVLRDVLTPIQGDSIFEGVILQTFSASHNETYSLDPNWILANSSIVSFIREIGTERVIRVVETELNDVTINVDEQETANLVKVHPNPFNESLRIIVKNPKSIQELKITDYSGKVVYSIDQFTNEIDLHTLASGIYILSVEDNLGRVLNQRILKQ